MLHTKFKASEPSSSKAKGFLIFSKYFYASNPVTSEEGPFWTQGPSLEQSKMVLKKKISKYFLCISMVQTTTHGHYLNKLGKAPLAKASYQISST